MFYDVNIVTIKIKIHHFDAEFNTVFKDWSRHINENPAHQLTIYECLNT